MLTIALAFTLLSSPPAQPFDQLATSRLSFLVGTWRGELHGAVIEETWSTFESGQAIGMFRMVDAKSGVKFQELMNLTVKGDTVELRLRHFDNDLVAFEEKDKPMLFKLQLAEKQKAIFVNAAKEKLTYARDGDRLTITLEKPKKPTSEFVMTLVK